LFQSDLVRHDRHGGDAELVQGQDIVEAFADDRATVYEDFAIAGFAQARGVLAEEFQAAVEAGGHFVLVGRFLALALVNGERQEGALLVLKAGIAGDPREELPVFAADGIDHVPSQRPTPLVVAPRREHADTPFRHRLGRETRVSADVGRSRRGHPGDVHDETLMQLDQIASLGVVAVGKRNVAERSRRRNGSDRHCRGLRRRGGLRFAGQHIADAGELGTGQFVAGGFAAGEHPVHQCEQVTAELTAVGVATEHLLRVVGVHRNLALPDMVAGAAEEAIEADFLAGTVRIEREAALSSRRFEARLRLQLIHVDVAGQIHVERERPNDGTLSARPMTNPVQLSPRDRSLLKLLSWTPATTALLVQASRTFEGGPFADERRLRERLQALRQAGFTRHWSTATIGGGLQNYYKLTPGGFQALHGNDAPQPPRAYFGEIAPSHFAHTLRLAEVIVATMIGAHDRHITLDRFFRENELTFPVGDEQVQPDCFFRFTTGGRAFNLAFEIDQSTETVDSVLDTSLRHRLELYDAYQDQLLRDWQAGGPSGERPRFRVVFLTPTVQRAYHILAVAGIIARVPSRRLVQAATQDEYLGTTDRLQTPIFVDHRGTWQSLIDLHPTSPSIKAPVRLATTSVNPFASRQKLS
jgi:hypothetical protein